VKILKRRIPGKHHREHSSQRLSTSINGLANMKSTILQNNNGVTLTSFKPETVGIRRNPLESRGSFGYWTIFSNRVQADT
jgi:hypothetical protein